MEHVVQCCHPLWWWRPGIRIERVTKLLSSREPGGVREVEGRIGNNAREYRCSLLTDEAAGNDDMRQNIHMHLLFQNIVAFVSNGTLEYFDFIVQSIGILLPEHVDLTYDSKVMAYSIIAF